MSDRLVIQSPHARQLQELLRSESGEERAAYLLCSQVKIAADPWIGQAARRYISREVVAIDESEIVSCSERHITWLTQSFVNVLKQAQEEDLTIALVHIHPNEQLAFSDVDDRNESDLLQLAHNRNGSNISMLSLVVTPDWQWNGRVWDSPTESHLLDLIQIVGDRIELDYPDRGLGQTPEHLNRQALAFGTAFNQDLAQLRVGIVGLGGTGSALCTLAARLGIRNFALFDRDLVEESNLNRLHGATMDDARNARSKVEVAARNLRDLGFGIEVRTYRQWINDPSCRDALRSCDIIFGCTDDHAGRLLLNRFAYYYATPVFDLGLAIELSQSEEPEIQALEARVTALLPGNPCLMCRGIIDPQLAGEQMLKYQNPEEYARRKEEAYVIGEGNPSPSVVLFTTDAASMALQELVHRLQGFRGKDGAISQKVRKFKLGEEEDRHQGGQPRQYCQVCGCSDNWGIGDVEPFLGLVG
jgi:molybdopterin/thiamine biosynthesis adenylyltransferase/proteasome lid subunit RPN8/RPN11